MVYEKFLQALKNELQQHLKQDYFITIQEVPKNNGIVLDGLCISGPDELASPTIYINSYYEQFKQGSLLSDLVTEILHIYSSPHQLPCMDLCHLNDFEQLKNKVVYKLIHFASNESLLKELPHIPYLDLAIIFYLYLGETEHGQITTLIYQKHQQFWNVSTEELYALATQNTPILFPAKIQAMHEVIKEILEHQFGKDDTTGLLNSMFSEETASLSPLYVFTNNYGLYGACCILYESILHHFSNSLDADLIILPSSIHEVLLLPFEDDLSYSELRTMVQEINRTEVPIEDRLSNHIYIYQRSDKQIYIASEEHHPPIKTLPS